MCVKCLGPLTSINRHILYIPGIYCPVPLSLLLNRKIDIKGNLNLKRAKLQVSLPSLIGFKKNSFLIGAAFQKHTLLGLASTFYSQ